MSSGRGNGKEGLTIPSSILAGGQSKKCEESWFHPVVVYESFSVATQQDKAQFESILN